MSPTAPLDTLLSYLTACGGCDRFEFHDAQGNPDPIRARAFAEQLRTQYASSVGTAVSVEQVANRVTVCASTEAAPV